MNIPPTTKPQNADPMATIVTPDAVTRNVTIPLPENVDGRAEIAGRSARGYQQRSTGCRPGEGDRHSKVQGNTMQATPTSRQSDKSPEAACASEAPTPHKPAMISTRDWQIR